MGFTFIDEEETQEEASVSPNLQPVKKTFTFIDDEVNNSEELIASQPQTQAAIRPTAPMPPTPEGFPEPPDEFTTGEKVLAGAMPIVGGIAGSLKGAAIGLATAGPPGALVGTVIGGAIGSAGGKGLGDVMEGIMGGEKREAGEIAKRAGKEALASVATDIVFMGAGKAVKAATPALRRMRKPIHDPRIAKRAVKRLELLKQKRNNQLQEVTRSAKKTADGINNNLKRLAEESKAFKTQSAKKSIREIERQTQEEMASIVQKIAKASDTALDDLGKEYDKIPALARSAGDSSVEMSETIDILKSIPKSQDIVTFKSGSAIKNVLSTLKKKAKKGDVFSVEDAIKTRRALTTEIRRLYKKGGDEPMAYAELLDEARQALDDQIDKLSGGAFKSLNSRYRETVRLAKQNRLFGKDLSDAGNYALSNAEDIVEMDIKKFIAQAEKGGEDFIKKGVKSGRSLFDVSTGRALKLTKQSDILRSTRIPGLVDMADQIDNSLLKLAKMQADKATIVGSLKDLGVPEKVAVEVGENIKDDLIRINKALTKEKQKVLASEILMEQRKVRDALAGGAFLSASVAGAYSGPVGLAMAGLVNLASLSQLSPRIADMLIPVFEAAASNPNLPKEFIKQIIGEGGIQIEEALTTSNQSTKTEGQ